ncbi:family 20 glycosylhydrolase [Microbulbifer thermotolerans]|uniref:family 20 glycosylhydrolase n=1 Tax=Microbulbifer thermotolerans TaxID=252514 RepID=UPI0026736ADD|nr:family 20 glycosylhydrolase [Microbulbifer thermotolerans]WKT59605.1 family 20 glycosylhydrolase [Microbulbifer thermotolerans]
MIRVPLISALLLAALLSACDRSGSFPAPTDSERLSSAERIARDFLVTQEVLTNFQGVDERLRTECKRAGGSGAICSSYRISLINQGEAIRPGEGDWAIYFHSIRRSLRLLNRDDFTLEHIKGDLHRLTPTEAFTGIAEGETLAFDLLAEYWMQSESDFMPRLFVVDGAGKAHVIASTDSDSIEGLALPITSHHPENWKRTADDANTLATPASRYAAFSTRQPDGGESWRTRIIPRPQLLEVTGEPVRLRTGIAVDAGPLESRSLHAFRQRLEQLGLAPSGPGAYPVRVDIEPEAFREKVAGAYTLQTKARGARIIGRDQAGAFYGLQSLLALVDLRSQTLARVRVEDAPRFPYRGLSLDVGRNFHSKAVVLKLLDQMAAYKLNRFHFHLSDDEGWRLEIPGLSELTEVGARRCFDPGESRCLLPQLGSGPKSDNSGSGFFTVEDYIHIVRYAAARHIEVIPEFDMPAHARAAVVAMEARYRKLADESAQRAAEYRLIDPQDDTQYLSVQFYDDSYINPCIDSTYHFIGKLIREVQAMHRAAGAPLASWHFGGDEALNILAGNGFEDAPGSDPDKGDVASVKRQMPWSESPACQKLVSKGEVEDLGQLGAFFAKRVSRLVAEAGIPTLAAWSDGVKHIENAGEMLATKRNYANAWTPLFWGGGAESVRLADAGFGVVQSHADFLYFDMPYELDPKESGYYWASRSTDTRKAFSYAPLNTAQLAEISTDRDGRGWSAMSPAPGFEKSVQGIQGQLWSEVVRTDAQVEYMLFPRLLALAERAWHRAEWELPLAEGQNFSARTAAVDKASLDADWNGFAAALGNRELLKLDLSGIAYRIPVPGVVVEDGALKTALPYPGLPLEYFDGERWRELETSVSADAVWAVRARSADGRRTGRAAILRALPAANAQR